MRACLALIVLLAFSISAGAADTAFPNLVGTWTVTGEGGILTYSEDPGERTHWKDGQTSIAAEVAFTKQDGRIARGTFKSARATEPFLAALGHDGKTIHFADTDGYTDGRVVDADTLEVVYRHSSAKSTVVAVTTWKRKK